MCYSCRGGGGGSIPPQQLHRRGGTWGGGGGSGGGQQTRWVIYFYVEAVFSQSGLCLDQRYFGTVFLGFILMLWFGFLYAALTKSNEAYYGVALSVRPSICKASNSDTARDIAVKSRGNVEPCQHFV